MASSLELRLGGCSARFFKRRSPGESGGDGELTRPKIKEQEVVEATRRSADGGYRGGTRVRHGCGLAWAKSLWQIGIRRR